MDKSVIISCRTLEKEVMAVIEETGCNYPVYFLPLGLHSDPKKLREYIQNLIDSFGNVDRVLLCVSGCGGGTRELCASTADLIIPKTSDCIDVLLSKRDGNCAQRDANGIFMTKSWIDASKGSVLDFEYMVQIHGKEQATAAVKKMYKGYEHFYIIDTGTYDVGEIKNYLAPLIEAIDGTVEIIPGEYHILRDLISGNWERLFQVVPKGMCSQ